MSIKHERLTWELLDYWRASGLPLTAIQPQTLLVSRTKGQIAGFVALGAERPPGTFVIEPLIADNGLIGERLVNALERLLIKTGAPGYFFYTDTSTPETHMRAVGRLAEKGIYRRLGDDQLAAGVTWYARRFADFEAEHVQ